MERDKLRTQELQEAGFRVLRLWENEIRAMELNYFITKLNAKAGGKNE